MQKRLNYSFVKNAKNNKTKIWDIYDPIIRLDFFVR